MKKTGNIAFWIIIVVILMFTASIIYNRMKPSTVEEFPQSQKESTQPKDSEEAAPLAPDFSLEDINGNKVTLSDYKGKVVFLNFWAVWCGLCVREMPDLDRANKDMLEEEQALILTVNVQEEQSIAKSFMEDRKLSMPVLMDYDGKVSGLYRVGGIPTTYIINKDGTLYGRILGATDYDTLMDTLEKILSESEE